MNFISINDFVGEINLDLGDSNVQSQFNSLGSQVIEDVLRDLLNDKLYDDLINDLSGGIPQSAQFLQLVNGTSYVASWGETIKFDGIKRMLRYFVYAYYLDSSWSFNSSIGQMNSTNENASLVNRSDLRKVRKEIYNKAVKLYNRCIVFINDNYTNYFTNNDYSFWQPIKKHFIGVIRTQTAANNYFWNKSSEEN